MPSRLFVAIPLGGGLRRGIAAMTSGLSSALPRASWSRSESLHVTLAFLGESDERNLPVIESAMGALAGLSKVEAVLGPAGFFPSERRPRVAWLSIEDGGSLTSIAAALRSALDENGIGYDSKPFRPHVTVARMRERWGSADVARFRRAVEPIEGAAAALDRVVLFRSDLGPRGAAHRPMTSIALRE